ncbi:MAG TPA: PEGA domain-containing protein [Usitatibacter sp.]|nr:PEGA domain-containing protein [Usitatibacter sp.]
MPAAPANPVHAHVAFLRIPQFDSKPVSEQASLKEQLENRVLAAIGRLPAADRVVLDAEDGIALVIFSDAEIALDVAQSIHRDSGGSALQVGVNYGPLALSSAGSDARVFGDGLSAAAAAARFADPSKLLVTDTFAKLLQATSPDRARELAEAGDFTDTRVRIHRFFSPDPELRAVRRRRIALYAIGGVIAILLIGVIGRDIYQPLFQSRPAVLKLEVKPRAEVFVDGISRGRTPPLAQIEVPPGAHKLTLKNPGFRTMDTMLDLKPGQRLTITQTLQKLPDPPKPKPAEKPDFWRDLKKKFN